MTLLKYIEWFACTTLVFAALQLAQRPLRRKNKKAAAALLFIVKMLAAVVTAYCSIAFCSRLVWNLGYLPGALYIVLFCDALADLAMLVMLLIRKELRDRSVVLVSMILMLLFTVYGTVNMQIIRPKEHVYTSDKLSSTHRFVFLADLHYGSSQSAETVKKALREIAALEPDFVLLGGDITDERTSAEEMHQIYAELGSLGAPVYFFYGNHDRQDHGDYLGGAKYTPEELEETILQNGITILRDDMEVISGDLVILGREDYSAGEDRCSVAELPARPDDAYVICVDHSPYQEDDIPATGADLQLSGHSHAGQFFPLQYVYRLGVNNIYGDYRMGGTDIYVSPGITGWYFPFRTAAHCNYEVITLEP